MIVLDHFKYQVRLIHEVKCVPQVFLRLNSLTFGYPTNTEWLFAVEYDEDYANWNFHVPFLDSRCATPRDILGEALAEGEPAPGMRGGHSSAMMQEIDPSFPGGYHKVQWDFPITEMYFPCRYVHPDKDVLLVDEDVKLLYGCEFGDIPPRILDYLRQAASYYEDKSWGPQNFSAVYTDCWKVKGDLPKGGGKTYGMYSYTPVNC